MCCILLYVTLLSVRKNQSKIEMLKLPVTTLIVRNIPLSVIVHEQ